MSRESTNPVHRCKGHLKKAIREAAVGDVGEKIEAAMAGPLQTIEQALGKLKESASTAEFASRNWQRFTNVFRWQQFALAVVIGILIGAVGHWYFATRGPEAEAAEYLLSLKHDVDQRPVQAKPTTPAPNKDQHTGPGKPKPKPKAQIEPEPESSPTPTPETAEPPQ